ncbi:MAG: endolytic transglycosylase MltG [Acidobacteriota bacterium]
MVIFGTLFAVAGGLFLNRALNAQYQNYKAPLQVAIKHGWNSGEVLRHLRQAGVLRDDFVPLIYLKTARRGDSLKAGVYRFDVPLSPIAVIDKLVRGDVVMKTVTIREGLDRFQIATIIREEGFGTAAQWEKAMHKVELIRDLDPDADSLEGYLFPETYTLSPGTSPDAIVATMVSMFRKQFGGELAFINTGLSFHDTVTLASIVETEAQLPADRPMIASVYLNRIRRHMPLQADPTVVYALKLAGRWDGNIRRVDLQIESPYNTYRTRGFPPGPIANAGLASLKAAAAPASTDFLYFVSRNDGSHVFSRNLAEHNRNVEIFQRQFWRQKRAASDGRR